MIKKWTLQSFKSVYNKTTLEIQPLTIFTGANSSGKSTIIQSILLTAQTLQSTDYPRSIILNGHIIRMGGFDDLKSNVSDNNEIYIGFEIDPNIEISDFPIAFGSRIYFRFLPDLHESVSKIECNYIFSSTGKEDEKEILQLQPRLIEFNLKTTPKENIKIDFATEEINIVLSKKSIQERVDQYQLLVKDIQKSDLHTLTYDVIHPINSKSLKHLYSQREKINGKIIGASFLHFLPDRFTFVYDLIEQEYLYVLEFFTEYPHSKSLDDKLIEQLENNNDFRKLVIDTCGELSSLYPDLTGIQYNNYIKYFNLLSNNFNFENIKKFFDSLSRLMKRNLSERFNEKSEILRSIIKANRKPIHKLQSLPLSDLSDFSIDYIRHFFTRMVKYLGPLRDEPKPIYPLAGSTDPKDIGFRGEHTAAVLDVHRNTLIEYIPTSYFEGKTPLMEVTDTLSNAISDWLIYMGIAKNVRTEDKGKLGHELRVTTSGLDIPHELTHVGVGVSQVLPLLVLSLLAERGSTLIFEQPELHLHPKVQTRLADFFVSLTMLDKQCIVETHSEYLINRLRYQSALSKNDEISSNTIIYFVEKHDIHSEYRPIKINKFGVIEDWPEGFFDENEENAAALLRASVIKRKKSEG